MIKKIAILLTIVFSALGLQAQLPVGGWTIHSPFGGVSSIAETKSTVYYLSAGSLFSVDKATNEVRSLNSSNDLNGGSIKALYPHPEGKYIIVVYNNCNMDRINADGSVINISDIADALLTGKPEINHVGFGKDRFYVAASFGLVSFNDKKNETIETMFTPLPVEKAYGLGDHVAIVYDKVLRCARQNDRLISLDNFKLIGGDETRLSFGESAVIGDNRILFHHGGKMAAVAEIDFEQDKLTYNFIRSGNANLSNIKHIVSLGPYKAFATNESNIYTYTIDAPANAPEITAFPSVLKGHVMSGLDGFGKLWAGNAEGICQFDITDRANPVQFGEKFGKTDFATTECNRIFTQPSGEIYFWNADFEAVGHYSPISNLPLKLSSYNHNNDKSFTNLTPAKVTIGTSTATTITRPFWILQDPNDLDVFYVSTWSNGVFRFKNGEQTHCFNATNSPLRSYWGYRVAYMGFDAFNNLWIAQERPDLENQNVHVLPYSELQKAEPSQEAWRTFDCGPIIYRSSVGSVLNKSDMIVFARGQWNMSLVFIKQNKTQSTADDTVLTVNSYIDQDNKTLSFIHINSLCEDADGRLWVGTDQGVFEISDPSKINSDVAQVNHLKVPRNDGTGLADYLLDAQMVTCIACDNSNRKWISTSTSGVYLVSENGDQILEHYTTDNSILPSNKVFSVACDPNSSSVFFATEDGVVEYNSTSAPSKENLDEVYAYPNPVRPDYSGWITVTGLMDNTLVKIADSAGNVFFQGRSEGGMITWDGCNANGDRVKTGVYYVFASHGTGNDSGSDNCVTKIMVIN